MPGAFGLADDVCHDRVPPDRLIEQHDMLDVHQLYRAGLLVPATEAQIDGKWYLRALPDGGKVLLDEQEIGIAWHRELPLRCFICPVCGRDCYKLHSVGGQWACRKCHQLDYSSRHRHRTVGRLNRIVWLRRRLGADLTPFTPLPSKPLAARKHWRLVLEVRRHEAALLTHARRDVAAVLERRHARSS